jgi:hypothetical protein
MSQPEGSGFYGDELAKRLKAALANFEATKETDPRAAQMKLARETRRAVLFKPGGRPRGLVVDRAAKLYEAAKARVSKPDWRKIAAAADPNCAKIPTHEGRRRRVRQIRSAVHSRLNRKTSVTKPVCDTPGPPIVKT